MRSHHHVGDQSRILNPRTFAARPLLALAIVPFPNWVMRRFKASKGKAIAMTAIAVVAFGLYLVLALNLAAVRIAEKLPTYEQRLAILHE